MPATSQQITGHQIQPVLDKALDARCHNIDQDNLLFNPSPEVDSLGELLAAAPMPPEMKAAAFNFIRMLAKSNQAEGGCENDIAGAADELILLARRAPSPGEALTVLGLARALRPLLKAYAEAEPDSFTQKLAAREIRQITSRVTSRQIGSSALAAQLGPRRHDLLVKIAGEAVS